MSEGLGRGKTLSKVRYTMFILPAASTTSPRKVRMRVRRPVKIGAIDQEKDTPVAWARMVAGQLHYNMGVGGLAESSA